MEKIQCNVCKKHKTLKYFSKTEQAKNKGWCRVCVSEYNKKYREKNKEKLREKSKEYYEKNKEKINEKNRIYSKKIYYLNVEKSREKARVHSNKSYWKNRDKRIVEMKEWREKNPEKMKISKEIIERIVKDCMGRQAEYWGREQTSRDLGFWDRTKSNWLFIPQKFFIDILNTKQYENETNQRPEDSGNGNKGVDSKNNLKQSALF